MLMNQPTASGGARKRNCGALKTPSRFKRMRCSSDSFLSLPAMSILFVGAERPDEFAEAMSLAGRGHRVAVVNPHESVAAHRFSDAGGTFIPTVVERLPLALGPFDCICENYPFTVRRIAGLCDDDPCPVWRSSRAMREY